MSSHKRTATSLHTQRPLDSRQSSVRLPHALPFAETPQRLNESQRRSGESSRAGNDISERDRLFGSWNAAQCQWRKGK